MTIREAKRIVQDFGYEAFRKSTRKALDERGPRARIIRNDDRYNDVYSEIEDLTHITKRLSYLSAAKAVAEMFHATTEYAMTVAKDVADDQLDLDAWREQWTKFRRQVTV